MKSKFWRTLSCFLVFSLLVYPVLAASSFPDVAENAPYAEAVEYLKDVGIIQGDDKGNFNPGKVVTRAEMATFVCRMLDQTENLPVSTGFNDVPITHWANPYISKAAEFGIVEGYGNGRFGPSDPVTYEQAVTMIIRAVGGEPEALVAGGYPEGYLAVAREYNLLAGVSAKQGEPMIRANIAILINNCVN